MTVFRYLGYADVLQFGDRVVARGGTIELDDDAVAPLLARGHTLEPVAEARPAKAAKSDVPDAAAPA